MNGKWWLVTWTTYGTWLPGDPRGFQSWPGREYVPPPARYAAPGEATYQPDAYAGRYRSVMEEMNTDPVRLTPDQRQKAVAAIIEEVGLSNVEPAILAIGSVHSHFVARFGGPIRATVGRLKAAATRRLHGSGVASDRVWCRNCHMISKATEREFRDAVRYVARHRSEGAAIHVWPGVEYLLADRADGMPSAWISREEH